MSPAIPLVSGAAPSSERRATLLLAAVVALGAGLRLWGLTRAPPNPFYDAAVRSMGRSWHNFFFGALEPGGRVSIDKPPIDLWVQVLSTKLLGFTTFALHLPEALCGAATVALLYVAVRSAWGRLAAILAALALAVLPISVLTARSDTMDSVMTALLVAALCASIRALQTGRPAWVLAAAALVGVAFNVKLAQALVPLPAFAVMWAVALPRRRAPVLLGATVTLLGVGMSWIVLASLTPTTQRPHPVGSVTGSIYRVVFVFNGLDRVSAKGVPLGPTDPTPAGPLRLVEAPGDYAQLIGLDLAAAAALLLTLLVTVATRLHAEAHAPGRPGTQTRAGPSPGPGPPAQPPTSRVARWTAVGLGLWLAIAVVLFSAIRHLQTRYLETASAPLAAVLGISAAALLSLSAKPPAERTSAEPPAKRWPANRFPARALAAALTAVALFALPVRVSLGLVAHDVTDAAHGSGGAQYSSFLRAHTRHTRYETASDGTLGVVGLISADDRPVLILNDVKGPLVRLATLQRLIRRGAVRYVLLDHPCTTGRGCPATTRWSLRHAVRIHGYLYRYEAPRGQAVFRRPVSALTQ